MTRVCTAGDRAAAARRPHRLRAVFLLAAIAFLGGVTAARGAELLLSPRDARVAPGGSLRFEVTVDGKAAAKALAWRVIPPSLGTVSQDGLFSAGEISGRGVLRVEAHVGAERLVAHALLHVGLGTGPIRLRVIPESARLAPGEEAIFRAELLEGAEAAIPVTWALLPAEAGAIDATGRARAAAWSGAARVVASTIVDGEAISGSARIWVGDGGAVPPEITIHPAEAELRSGERLRFEARLRPPVPDSVAARIRWSLFPERLGILGEDGTLSAGAVPGEGRVVASLVWEGRAVHAVARARVLPLSGAPALQVEPPAALLAPGRSIGFTARAAGAEDARLTDLRWSVAPSTLGAIGPDGVLRAFEADASAGATLEGDVVAHATVGGMPVEGRARVRIAPAASAELELRPRFITTDPGGEVPVRAFLDGRALPVEVPVTWEVIPPAIGQLTPDGLFTANRIIGTSLGDDFGRREGVLVATASLPEGKTARGTARIVVVPSFRIPQVTVLPRFVTLGLTEQASFRVAPLGEDVAAAATPPVAWLVKPERLGAIDAAGVFVPNVRFGLAAAIEGLREVEGRVVAEVRVSPGEILHGEAHVVVRLPDPALLTLTIEPAFASLSVLASQRFVGRLGGRDVRELPLEREWTVSPASLGTITQDGFFTPIRLDLPSGTTQAGAIRLTVTSRTGTSREAESSILITY